MDQLHNSFPDLKHSFSFSTCMLQLIEKYITTIPKAKAELPKMKEILRIYYSEGNGNLNTFSQKLTNINYLFKEESDELHKTVKGILKLDNVQKVAKITDQNSDRRKRIDIW